MPGAQELRSEQHFGVRRTDEVAAQRRRWTFYETIRIAGASSSGKTRVFGTRIRRFESSRPSQKNWYLLQERRSNVDHMRIFSGNSNIPLAKEICAALNLSLGLANVRNFSDGEIQVDIDESVRGMDVFVVQSTGTPGNVNLMEPFAIIDA